MNQQNEPPFNISVALICSKKALTMAEIRRIGEAARGGDCFVECNVTENGQIRSGHLPNLPCKRFFMDMGEEANVLTLEKMLEVSETQNSPTLQYTVLLEGLIQDHELQFVPESDGTNNSTLERIRIDCEDGMLFHYFNSIQAPFKARKDLTELAQRKSALYD